MQHRIQIHKAVPNTANWDFSHLLDAPAGKHGFVSARNGHLYFADGTRAKFIGFNIAARSNMPDHETAEKMARRFASMGVNIIRLHAADNVVNETPCSWACAREYPLLDYSAGSSRKFCPEGLERFDYLVAKLKEAGIYLHIDTLVARSFVPGDDLDYPGTIPPTAKCYPTMNERLIQLQQEYMKEFLCHVNPYTGLALIDDPAVVTVQISNEESFIKGTDDTNGIPELEPYRQERQARFNHFLLMKYHTRKRLAESWTYEGVCALGEDEDPERGTVRVVQGSFHQPTNEPMGDWNGPVSPARYADYMAFGIEMNRNYYRRMKDFLISLGVKVPIVCSNLLGGAADVYGHMDGDLMENNSYFNHPIPPFRDGMQMCIGPTEYVTANPITMQTGIGSMATTLLSFGAVAVVKGKPFMLSEWNEYGLHPFHSTGVVQTVAYACLNDWDGLIIYNHHTSENWDDQPADEIRSVFDCYNDPSMVCQWGFMATMFLKGLVAPAKNSFDVVYTRNDLLTLPTFHSMPTTFLPYIGSMRNVFLESEQYQGDADVAINAGFLNAGDLSCAKHAVYYAWSPFRDALRRSMNPTRLSLAAQNTKEIASGVHLGEQKLVFDRIREASGFGDYTGFLSTLDKAMKTWGVLDEGTGFVDGKLISDTGELLFDPNHARFAVTSPQCAFFSGAPEEETILSERISAKVRNDRISISLLPEDGKSLNDSNVFRMTAMGRTGMDGSNFTDGPEYMPGLHITIITMGGKLYAETMEGEILVKAKAATLEILDPIGNVIAAVEGQPMEDGVKLALDGTVPGIQFRMTIEEIQSRL